MSVPSVVCGRTICNHSREGGVGYQTRFFLNALGGCVFMVVCLWLKDPTIWGSSHVPRICIALLEVIMHWNNKGRF